MIFARCKKCHSLLFDVPNFEAFHKPSPVAITCRGCGTKYFISQNEKGDIVGHRYGRKRSKLKMVKHD